MFKSDALDKFALPNAMCPESTQPTSFAEPSESRGDGLGHGAALRHVAGSAQQHRHRSKHPGALGASRCGVTGYHTGYTDHAYTIHFIYTSLQADLLRLSKSVVLAAFGLGNSTIPRFML